MICKICGKEVDEAEELIEDDALLEALNYYIDITQVCNDCLLKLNNTLEEATITFVEGFVI